MADADPDPPPPVRDCPTPPLDSTIVSTKDPSGAGDSSSAPEARYGVAPDPEGPDEYYNAIYGRLYQIL